MENQQRPTVYTTGNLLSVMWQPGWEGSFGEECMYACSVILLYLTLCDPMDYSPPGSSVHGIFPARILEWVTISTSRESSWPRIKLTSPVPPALQVDSAQIFGHHSPDKLTHQINHCNYSLTMCFYSSLSNWECLLYWSVCVCEWVCVCVCVCV